MPSFVSVAILRIHVPFLRRVFVWSLIVVIYAAGLAVPLMDVDSAHHANIALRMHETGDYVNLVDQGKDYLDKPHLLFWLAALSYQWFGVSGFSYKFFSFLASLLAFYSTYKLGALLYTKAVGRVAGLILITSFGFILANNDVRMDALLTAAIIFSIWQLAAFTETRRWISLAGAALGLAMGFSTKGMTGIAMPLIALAVHLFSAGRWKVFFDPRWLVLPLLTLLFISPVLYCYYLQFDLHPEKVIRGHTAISGVRFILWSQSMERLEGSNFGSSEANDPFFFIGTFLWAFLPWSLVTLFAMINHIKQRIRQPLELLTVGTVLIVLVILSFSGFKLPHYLNILFPLFSVTTAAYLFRARILHQTLFRIQASLALLLIVFSILVNQLIFPPVPLYLYASLIVAVIAGFFLFHRSGRIGHVVYVTTLAALVANLLFSMHYYPNLLSYQAGKYLAEEVHAQGIPKDKIYFLSESTVSNSFEFYMEKTIPRITMDSLQQLGSGYVYTNDEGIKTIKRAGLEPQILSTRHHYHVSTPKKTFWKPKTRLQSLTAHYMVLVKEPSTKPTNPSVDR